MKRKNYYVQFFDFFTIVLLVLLFPIDCHPRMFLQVCLQAHWRTFKNHRQLHRWRHGDDQRDDHILGKYFCSQSVNIFSGFELEMWFLNVLCLGRTKPQIPFELKLIIYVFIKHWAFVSWSFWCFLLTPWSFDSTCRCWTYLFIMPIMKLFCTSVAECG